MMIVKPNFFKNVITSPPFIIAEIGVNHENSFETAIKIIDLAKEGGADAVKFQSYKADLLASKDSPAYWDTSKEKTLNQNELFKKYDSFNENDYKKLAEYCNKIDIQFLSTPFDIYSVTYLESIVPFFKIASADINNFQLLERISKTNKPIILSTGASNLEEIDEAISVLEKIEKKDICLMHCILNYPTENINANLSMIKSLKKKFPDMAVGYSDHTLPDKSMRSMTLAYLLGATIIEKHFTHDKSLPGNDHYHAMDCNDLKKFRLEIIKIKELIGIETEKKPIEGEHLSRLNARRSIVTNKTLLKGHVITKSDIICKRPGSGITANNWFKIIGCEVMNDLPEDYLLKWSDLKIVEELND